jgi:hypothetical protein
MEIAGGEPDYHILRIVRVRDRKGKGAKLRHEGLGHQQFYI